ncbi:unnamed protein product [Tetraodon nigroviridis]|uniref:(spotted green pufferfish) hypothetical protein n=1 Tax=Tetraodon nigroviridis TaxID=99883 RepID=Q4S7T3_TETNG|nr:unnamed protein product [Tetraodon nigroviridis]
MTGEEEERLVDPTAAAEPGDSMIARQEEEEEEEEILAAWKSMTWALQQRPLGEPSAPGPPQSFLSRQRQAAKARRSLGPQPEPR